ncbi:hypothetical protein FG05_30541 [Fusarium graminearum]|nr:hypothetical protein FG05_30541 [Fusarium graminearum]
MFQAAIQSLNSVFDRHPWVAELAGILPLSALIDFIEIPSKLHILELSGSVPLWSWAITPSGSRLLLAKPNVVCGKPVRQDCYMDRFGNSPPLEALDGRYGERYFVSSPETLRLLLDGTKVEHILNDHLNMTDDKLIRRVQNVEIIHFERKDAITPANVSSGVPTEVSSLASSRTSLYKRFASFVGVLHKTPFVYLATAFVGWIFWVCTLIISGLFEFWICFAFVLLLPITGVVVSLLFGKQPRKLLVDMPSPYVRLLLIAEHMNTDSWKIIIGESSVVNSLANRPLEPSQSPPSSTRTTILRQLLRLSILGQWGLALGAAATKQWDAYLIGFWIAFPIFCHGYLISPSFCAKGWLEQQAGVGVKRYRTQASTRRSLLNLIIALNPDSFGLGEGGKIDYEYFDKGGMKWINPILAESYSRREWEEATRQAIPAALHELSRGFTHDNKFRDPDSEFPNQEWNEKFRRFIPDKDTGKFKEQYYWRRFIPEGIYLAAKIKQVANLPLGKLVRPPKAS